MEKLIIESSGTSPFIDFDFEKGVIEIKGRSTVENASAFYARLVEAIKRYSQEPKERELTTINITLEWFNTGSAKALLDILRERNFL